MSFSDKLMEKQLLVNLLIICVIHVQNVSNKYFINLNIDGEK